MDTVSTGGARGARGARHAADPGAPVARPHRPCGGPARPRVTKGDGHSHNAVAAHAGRLNHVDRSPLLLASYPCMSNLPDVRALNELADQKKSRSPV
jgi:hypothetical protein